MEIYESPVSWRTGEIIMGFILTIGRQQVNNGNKRSSTSLLPSPPIRLFCIWYNRPRAVHKWRHATEGGGQTFCDDVWQGGGVLRMWRHIIVLLPYLTYLHLHLRVKCLITNNSNYIHLDLGVTLVCQSDPTWYKSDPKSTSSRRLVPKTTWGDLGKKQPTFHFKSTSYMALCCMFTFVYYDSVVRS